MLYSCCCKKISYKERIVKLALQNGLRIYLRASRIQNIFWGAAPPPPPPNIHSAPPTLKCFLRLWFHTLLCKLEVNPCIYIIWTPSIITPLLSLGITPMHSQQLAINSMWSCTSSTCTVSPSVGISQTHASPSLVPRLLPSFGTRLCKSHNPPVHVLIGHNKPQSGRLHCLWQIIPFYSPIRERKI